MNRTQNPTPTFTHKSYREDWTLGGLVGSLAVVGALFALLVAPLLVTAVAVGAVSAHLLMRVTASSSRPPATPSPSGRRA